MHRPQLTQLITICAGADVLFIGKGADVGSDRESHTHQQSEETLAAS